MSNPDLIIQALAIVFMASLATAAIAIGNVIGAKTKLPYRIFIVSFPIAAISCVFLIAMLIHELSASPV